MALQELADRTADPRRRVDAVRDRPDLVRHRALPRRVGGLRVEPADGVGILREAEAEGRHVELCRIAVGAQAHLENSIHRDASGPWAPVAVQHRPGDATDQIGVEPFVTGRDGRVDGEDAVRADPRKGLVQRRAIGDGLARSLGEQEGGVALVQVPHGRRQSQRPDGAHSANAEDELLVEPHLATADVQDVGDRAIGPVILRCVRVQKEHRHATDLGAPDIDTDIASGQLHGDGQRVARAVEGTAEWQARGFVVRVGVFLVTVRVDRLAEVAPPIEEPDAHQWQGHVAGRLQVIARQHAQAARVDPERFVDPVLGAEIRDRAVQFVGVTLVEPVVAAVREVVIERADHVAVLRHEVRVIEESGPLDRAGEDRDRVVCAAPRDRVQATVERLGAGVPGPVQVIGEPLQPLEGRRHADKGRSHRRDLHERIHEGVIVPVQQRRRA